MPQANANFWAAESFFCVSIIIPSFNQARFLEETLESALSQEYPHIEVIVIDGGSTDGSVDIIRRYEKRLAYWESEKDRGQSHAINKGFARCRGEIVNWLCSDDVLLDGAVSEVVRAFERNPSVVGVAGHALYTDENSNRTGIFCACYSGYRDLIRFWSKRVDLPQPAFFLRRSALEKSPIYLDETFHHAMDFDLWCRVLEGESIEVLDKPLATYRRHQDAKTTASDRWIDEKLLISRRYWGPRWKTRYGCLFLGSRLALRKRNSRLRWDQACAERDAGRPWQALANLAMAVLWQPFRALSRNTAGLVLSLAIGPGRYRRWRQGISAGKEAWTPKPPADER